VESYSGVTMPAMAEQRFGAARGVQNFICVELSNGVGSSICCNGMPVAGAKGVAGELGHTVIEYGTAKHRLCYCGKPDCMEMETAYPALVSDIMDALHKGVFSTLVPGQPVTVEAIRTALEQGDRMCMHYVKETALRIGVAIANAVNLLNPELVVLHGFMLELGPWFLQHLEQSLRENVLSIAADFKLRVSSSMETLLPLGAVAEIFSSYLRSNDYQWVYQLSTPDNGGKL
jgi:glucokinase